MHTEKLNFASEKNFFRKYLFEYKVRFAVEKKNKKKPKKMGQFQNCLEKVAIKKNAIQTIFLYGNCMMTVLFKKKPLFFL